MATDLIDLTGDDDIAAPSACKLYVKGKPLATPRPGLFKNGYVNKKSRQTKAFGCELKTMLVANGHCTENSMLFDADEPVAVTLWFFLPRPSTDFKCNKKSTGRLKARAKEVLFPTICPDVDNLCKFVLDAMNGVAYPDDKQVVKLVAYKCRDTDEDGPMAGGTCIEIEKFDPAVHGGFPAWH